MFCEFLFSLTKTLSKRANQKSKKLSCKPFSRQARNGFSLLSGCRGDSYLSFFFSFLTVWMHFQPASEKSQSKQVEYVFSLSANHFQPANPESLTNQKSPIRSLVVIVPKLKSLFSSFENLRGIVRPLKLSEVESLSKVNCLSIWNKKDSSSKIFQYKSVSFFLFNYAR